jgi:uncharacterized protein YbjT (DUF2867 family)
VLVVGGAGKTGRRVTDRLNALGVPVRPVSRSSRIRFDWEQPETWPAALEGMRTAYVTYYPDVSLPAAATAITRLVELAAGTGMERVVLLSGRGEPGAQVCEDIVMAALPESTVLTCALFAQNFTEGMLHGMVGDGAIVLPADPRVSEPFLDVEDIANSAVAALLDDRHRGRRYELTGPESLTFGRAAAILSAVSGQPVEFLPVSPEDFVEWCLRNGLPRDVAEMLVDLFAQVLDGRNEHTTDGVQRLLGRPAAAFADVVARAVGQGTWTDERAGAA